MTHLKAHEVQRTLTKSFPGAQLSLMCILTLLERSVANSAMLFGEILPDSRSVRTNLLATVL